MSTSKINIAIDGYSSCGKSTLAKALAKELNYVFIDTGAMYRAVTLFALRKGLASQGDVSVETLVTALPEITITFKWNDDEQRSLVQLNGETVEQEIREMDVANHVSAVASIPEVRKKLVELQQKMGESKGVVMDGRDIGTVVFPNAELKIFMTASPDVRVQRRLAELKSKGQNVTAEEVRENIESRDYQDTHRAADPLRQADDARVLDNSNLTPDDQLALALSWVNESL
jgi:cytidylate kinase